MFVTIGKGWVRGMQRSGGARQTTCRRQTCTHSPQARMPFLAFQGTALCDVLSAKLSRRVSGASEFKGQIELTGGSGASHVVLPLRLI
jgi:hypothetical protein